MLGLQVRLVFRLGLQGELQGGLVRGLQGGLVYKVTGKSRVRFVGVNVRITWKNCGRSTGSISVRVTWKINVRVTGKNSIKVTGKVRVMGSLC